MDWFPYDRVKLIWTIFSNKNLFTFVLIYKDIAISNSFKYVSSVAPSIKDVKEKSDYNVRGDKNMIV